MGEDSRDFSTFKGHEKHSSLDNSDRRESKQLTKFKDGLRTNGIDAVIRKEEYRKVRDLIRDIHENPPDEIEYFDKYDTYGIMPLMVKKNGENRRVIFGLRCTKENSNELRDTGVLSVGLEEEVYPFDRLGKDVKREYIILTGEEFDKLEDYVKDKDKREKLLDLVEISEAEMRKTYDGIVRVALKRGASDIHIEPRTDKESVIRFRIDGTLRGLDKVLKDSKYEKISEEERKRLVQVIKGDADLQLDEKRRPQDGRITYEKEGGRYNLRVSTINTNHGERVVLRILKSQEAAFNLEKLGYPTRIYRDIKDLIYSPSGIILVTGPTGSGKTTTLYSILQERNKEEVNIMTVEDPVEIDLKGINQTQKNDTIDYTFANALRSFLRQDPNIIFVGEIRDEETAQMAAHAAKTGPLVFSTLHARDSIDTLLRLHDLKIDKRDLATCLKGVISQRLARRLCEHCREEYPGYKEINDMFGEKIIKEEFKFWKKPEPQESGICKYCDGVGYKGRIVIPELWIIGDEEREMIEAGNMNHDEYSKVALKKGMWDLMRSGIRLALTARTSLDEIFRVAVSKRDFLDRKSYIAKIIPEILQEVKDRNKPGDTSLPA